MQIFMRSQPNEREVAESMLGSNGWGTAIQKRMSEASIRMHACPRSDNRSVQGSQGCIQAHGAAPANLGRVASPFPATLDMAQPATNEIDATYTQLAQELSAVLPTGIEPAGRGVLKILCAYPGGTNESVGGVAKAPPKSARSLQHGYTIRGDHR